jgi:hypothetical protein
VDTLQDRAGGGYAALAIWKSRPFGRVVLATSMGFPHAGSGRHGPLASTDR